MIFSHLPLTRHHYRDGTLSPCGRGDTEEVRNRFGGHRFAQGARYFCILLSGDDLLSP